MVMVLLFQTKFNDFFTDGKFYKFKLLFNDSSQYAFNLRAICKPIELNFDGLSLLCIPVSAVSLVISAFQVGTRCYEI